MKTKIKILSGALPPINSLHLHTEETNISIATYTTAYARSLTTAAVGKLRSRLSLLFSCCLTKRTKPVLPIGLGEPASWVIGKSEKGICAAATPVVSVAVLS